MLERKEGKNKTRNECGLSDEQELNEITASSPWEAE